MGAIQNYVTGELDTIRINASQVESFAHVATYNFEMLSPENLAITLDLVEKIRTAIQNIAKI